MCMAKVLLGEAKLAPVISIFQKGLVFGYRPGILLVHPKNNRYTFGFLVVTPEESKHGHKFLDLYDAILETIYISRFELELHQLQL